MHMREKHLVSVAALAAELATKAADQPPTAAELQAATSAIFSAANDVRADSVLVLDEVHYFAADDANRIRKQIATKQSA